MAAIYQSGLKLASSDGITEPIGHWDGGGDGVTWTQAANWSRDIVPGSTDDVVIDVTGTPTILVGSSVTVKSITCAENLSVTGGTFKVLGPSTVAGAFTLANLTTLVAEGAAATFTASGATTIDASNIYATSGAVVTLPGVTSYSHTVTGYGNDRSIRASGAGSVLSFPNLATITGGTYYYARIFVQAQAGGQMLMPALTTVTGSVYVQADGAESVLNVPALQLMQLADTDYNGLIESNGGRLSAGTLANFNVGRLEFNGVSTGSLASLVSVSATSLTMLNDPAGLPNLTTIDGSTVVVKGTTPLPVLANAASSTLEFRGGTGSFPAITNISASNIYATSGAVVTLPGVTSYSHTVTGYGNNRVIRATGAGSVLSFPNLTTITGGTYYYARILVQAQAGGQLQMPALTTVTGSVHVQADGTGSVLSVPALQSMQLADTDYNGLNEINGGRLNAGSLATMSKGTLNFSGVSTGSVASLVSASATTLTLLNDPAGLPNLTTINGSTVVVKGTTPLPVLATVASSTLEFRGGTGIFPAITDISASNIYTTSGAVITLPGVTSYNHTVTGYGNDRVIRATGAGSVLSFPNLTTITGGTYYYARILVQAQAGGQLLMPALTTVTGSVHVQSDGAGSVLSVPALQSMQLADTDYNGLNEINGGRLNAGSLATMSKGTLNFSGVSTGSVASLVSVSATTLTLLSDPAGLPNLTAISGSTVVVKGTTPLPVLATVASSTLEFRGGTGIFPAITDINASNIYTTSGAVITLPGVTSYNHTVTGYGNDRVIRATGAGSVLSFPNLTTITGGTYYYARILVQAQAGGQLQMPALTTVTGSVHVQADGTGSVLGVAALQSMQLVSTDYNGLNEINGGRLNAGSLANISNGMLNFSGVSTGSLASLVSMSGTNLTMLNDATGLTGLTTVAGSTMVVKGTTPLPVLSAVTDTNLEFRGGTGSFPALSNITASNIYVTQGAEVTLPGVTSYSHTVTGYGNDRVIRATGAGSVLSFPNLTTITGGTYYYARIFVQGLAGGQLQMPALTTVTGSVYVQADGAGSMVSMNSMSSAKLVSSDYNGFYATNGGRISITAIEAMSNGRISFTGVNSFVDVGTNPGVPVVGATRGVHGPLGYRSFADSPFREVPFNSFHLEDGEDGAINTPGVTFTNHKPGGSGWGVRTAETTTDSVDGDDGNIDGNGTGGKSLAPLAEDGSEGDGVTVSFQAAVLGYLPTHAGFVWTDGSPGKAVLVEFYDGAGAQVASIGPVVIADESRDGTAADDHFFGAVHRAGIGSFRVRVLGGTGTMELDHVQYGTTTGVQAPATPRFAADLQLVRGGPVNDALRLGDGSVVAGGAFSRVNGQAHRSLVKLGADGSVAAAWTTPVLSGGSQEVPMVTALAADATRLFIGGDFAQLAGAARPNLCVVTSATGAAGAALSAYPDRPVVALAVDPVSNSLHVATGNKVFRYNLATTSPISQVSWPSAWVDAGERIESVLPLGAHVYVAGRFDSLQGQARTHLARVSALTGAVDATWNPSLPVGWHVEQLLTDGVDLFIRARDLAQPDRSASVIHKLDVAGAALDPGWTPVGGLAIADAVVGAPFLYVADRAGSIQRRALADGTLDASWSAVTEGHATALAAAPDGLLAFGPFRTAGGAAAFGAVKLDMATASKSAGFTAAVTSAGSVHAMALQTDGKVLLGGDFQEIQGKPVMNFARLEAGSDRFDPAWAPVFSGGPVRVIDVSGHEVHVGGDFIRVGVLPVSLARFTLGADEGPHGDWLPDVSSVTSLLVAPDLIHAGARIPTAAGDRWLGRMARRGNGIADPGWSPLVRNDLAPVKIKTMAVEGDFLYFGGDFTSVGGAGRLALARVGLAEGQVATNWNPNLFRSAPAVARVEKLIVRDGFVYLAGDFNQIQGKPQNHLARLALADADFDVSWRPSAPAPLNSLLFAGGGLITGTNNLLFYQTNSPTTPARVMAAADGPLRQIQAENDRVLAAGAFSTFGGIAAPGFGAAALTGQARVVFSGRFVHFYPDDSSGAYANGFKMDALTGGLLVDPATGQFIATGGTVTIAQGAAGLLWLRNPDATAQEIKVTANGGSSASDLDPATVNPVVSPGFSFSQTTITVREGEMASPFVEYHGTAQVGTVSYEILPLTATPFDGLAGDYVDAPVRVNFNVNPRRGVFEGPISIPILEDGTVEAAEEFYVRLIQPGGGIPLGRNTLLKVIVIDNPPDGNPPSVLSPLLFQVPSALPVSAGTSLTVNLSSSSPGAKWRLWGEPFWRDPGTSIALLQGGGRHRVEYRPLDGYKALLSPDFAFITDGQAATLSATYQTDTDLLLDGEVTVGIWPPALSEGSDPASRGQWRVAGETAWRDGGSAVTLTHGKHLIEFKEGVAGWIAPGPRFVEVAPDGDVAVRAAYTVDRAAAEPAALPFSGPGSIQSAPFHFVGQIESNFGYATGTAVSEQVVLTTARAMWNPETLGIATRLAWFHQQDSSQQRVVPRGPRNVLIRAGYAAERAEDESEGTTPGITGTLASDRLDAAVMYFLGSPAARGGFSGYLADFTRTPGFHPALLDGSSRLLCGYPVSGIPAADRGRMHATLPGTAPLASVQDQIYRSSDLEGRPGMEGAPLLVQHANGQYYPAAVYLGESGGAVFRAIDRHLAQLIYRAEAIANTLSNGGTGGGDEFANRLTGDDYPIGFVTASLVPGQGRWRALDPETGEPLTGWFFSGEIVPLVADSYVIAYEPVGGLANPLPVTVEARSGQLTPELKAYYPLLLRYEDWRTEVFSPAQLLDPQVSGPAADPDGDGFDNRMEFGLGLPPLSPSPVPADVAAGRPGTPYFEVRRQAGVPGGEARFTFLRRYATDVLDVDYEVEFADSPAGPWTLNTTVEPEYGGVDQEWQSVAFPLPLASERRARFGRIRVVPRTPPNP